MYLRILIFSLVLVWIHCATEESPGFFLKVSKNIPRLGRRAASPLSDYDSFFLKSSKIVPRIGRSNPGYVSVLNVRKIYLFQRIYTFSLYRSITNACPVITLKIGMIV